MGNRKHDFACKAVHKLLTYETVYFQDENLKQWKKRFGKSLQHSALGMIKARLAASDRAVMVGKYEATTQFCRNCHTKTPTPLNQRTWTCSSCGISEPRDLHAALNMIYLGRRIGTSGTGGSACGGSVRPLEPQASAASVDEAGNITPSQA